MIPKIEKQKPPEKLFQLDEETISQFVDKVNLYPINYFDCATFHLPDITNWFREHKYNTSIQHYLETYIPMLNSVKSRLTKLGTLWIRVDDKPFEIKAVRNENMNKRNLVNRKNGVKDMSYDRKVLTEEQKIERDIIAETAERFVLNHLGGIGDQSFGEKDFSIDGWVFDVKNNPHSVQVKWTARGRKCVITPNVAKRVLRGEEGADIYVLVSGETVDRFKIEGWVTGEKMKKSKTSFPGYSGERTGVDKKDMESFDKLVIATGQVHPGEMIGLHKKVIQELSNLEWFPQRCIKINEYDNSNQYVLAFSPVEKGYTYLRKSGSWMDDEWKKLSITSASRDNSYILDMMPEDDRFEEVTKTHNRIYHSIT